MFFVTDMIILLQQKLVLKHPRMETVLQDTSGQKPGVMCSLQTTSQVYGELGKISFMVSLSLALWQCFFVSFFCQTFQLRVRSGRKNSNLQSAAIDPLSAVCH